VPKARTLLGRRPPVSRRPIRRAAASWPPCAIIPSAAS